MRPISYSLGKLSCALLVVLIGLTSCDPSKRINQDYKLFQNDRNEPIKVQLRDLTIKPNDLLSIQILANTLEQKDAARYNIAAEQGYLVGLNGIIEIPFVGDVRAAGLTRFQLQEALRSRLTNYVKDPVVIVRFQQFTINVLGEVLAPGVKTFPTDKVTIVDAISQSGGLTDFGQRQDVMVSREDDNGVRKIYEIDLRSNTLFLSPVYQLQQNDIVYVNPNRQKLKAVKEKSGLDASRVLQLGLTAVGAITTILVLFRQN